jgi:alkylation response protein AidB-like acyl-CoA dehydrogenase
MSHGKTDTKTPAKKADSFGSDVPFAEPYHYNDLRSPHYTDSHRRFRAIVRKFVDEELIPYVDGPLSSRTHSLCPCARSLIRRCRCWPIPSHTRAEWDEKGTYPPELHDKAYRLGIYGAIWPAEYGGTPPAEAKGGVHDMFHDLIMVDELARCGAGGVLWAVFFSFGIALPPILSVGSKYLK